MRAVLAAIAAVLGYVSVTGAIGYANRTQAPERAHLLAPRDGRVTAALAWRFTGADGGIADPERAERLAREALRQDATAVAAVVTRGLDAQAAGDEERAARFFAYAQILSRRDLATQLWMIESAVARGNVPGALRHYDIALRTSRHAPDLLFPILISAIADRDVRNGLAHTLAAKPVWAPLFVEYASANSPDPRVTALLFSDLHRLGFPVSTVSRSLLIDALASRGLYDEAWSYYVLGRGSIDRRTSRDPQFATDQMHPTLFDWRIVGDNGVSASIQQGDRGGILDFTAPANAGGAVVQQTVMLPPGKYRLAGHSVNIDQPPSSRPYWMLTCNAGAELGRVELPNSIQAHGKFAGDIMVPSKCPVQKLTLIARPSDSMAGVAGQIDSVRLAPAP